MSVRSERTPGTHVSSYSECLEQPPSRKFQCLDPPQGLDLGWVPIARHINAISFYASPIMVEDRNNKRQYRRGNASRSAGAAGAPTTGGALWHQKVIKDVLRQAFWGCFTPSLAKQVIADEFMRKKTTVFPSLDMVVLHSRSVQLQLQKQM